MVPFELAKIFPKHGDFPPDSRRSSEGESQPARIQPRRAADLERAPPRRDPRTAPALERHTPARRPRRAQVHVAAGHLPKRCCAPPHDPQRDCSRWSAAACSNAACLDDSCFAADRLAFLGDQASSSGSGHVRHASTRLAALEQHRGRTPAARTRPADDRRLRRNERTVALGVRQLAAQLPVEAVQQRMHAGTPGGDLV